MRLTDQIDLLHTWLAAHPRPAGMAVSDHLQICASAGDVEARRVLASGLFNVAGSGSADPTPAPIVPRELERANRLATQHVPAGKQTREPRRPILQSDRVTPWLPK